MLEDHRTEIIRALCGSGLSDSEALMAFDVANHACEEAQQTAIRICDTLPDHMRLHAAIVVTSALAKVFCDTLVVIKDTYANKC